jgi:hypothetical protein
MASTAQTNLCSGNLLYPFEIFPEDRRSVANKTDESCIPFIIITQISFFKYLEELNFDVVETRSVSNIRSGRLKKILPYEP